MPEINVKTETEHERSWTFNVEVQDGGTAHEYDVTLNWSDYEHWSRGQVAPEKVVHAAFEFLLQREPATAIMKKFDCAVIRRYFSDVDKELPKLL